MSAPLRIIADENIPGLSAAFSSEVQIRYLPGREIKRHHLQQTDVLLVRSVTQVNADLVQGTPIKFIGSATIGLDHIDLSYLNKFGIGFAYAPGSNAQSVVEYVLAAIAYWLQQENKSFETISVGIVGVGRIGGLLQMYLEKLGVRCLLCDPPRQAQQPDLPFCSLQEITKADVISFHVPLNLSQPWPTKSMIDEDFLSSLGKGQLLINSARGDILDNQMALNHYQNYANASALVLDVWQNEPQINVDLLKYCLLATPHIAGYAVEGKWRATLMLCQALAGYFNISVNSAYLDAKTQTSNPWVPQADEKLLELLQSYYPIARDDKALRGVINNLPQSFDILRKNYLVRHEFLAPIAVTNISGG